MAKLDTTKIIEVAGDNPSAPGTLRAYYTGCFAAYSGKPLGALVKDHKKVLTATIQAAVKAKVEGANEHLAAVKNPDGKHDGIAGTLANWSTGDGAWIVVVLKLPRRT